MMTSTLWNFGGLAHHAIKTAWNELFASLRISTSPELGEFPAAEMTRKLSISSLLTLAGLGTTAVVQAQSGCPDFTTFSMVCEL